MPPIDKVSSTAKPVPLHASPNPQARKRASTTFHLLAGLGSGFTSSILLQPADLLKTRLQQAGSKSLVATLRLISSQPHPIRQLWRGTLPSVIRTSVGSALYFTALNALRTRVASSNIIRDLDHAASGAKNSRNAARSSTLPQLSSLANLSCGAFARASVGFMMMPITVIKVRYESNFYNYTSIPGAIKDIAAREGLKGFFSGFGATAIRDAPYAGLYVVFYEQGKKAWSKTAAGMSSLGQTAATAGSIPSSRSSTSAGTQSSGPARLSPGVAAAVNFLSSTTAAAAATLLTNPPDAIKTRLQLQPSKYKNSLQALKLMLKEEGMRSLFDGMAMRMARKALSSALAWTVYEEVVRRAEAKFVAEER